MITFIIACLYSFKLLSSLEKIVKVLFVLCDLLLIVSVVDQVLFVLTNLKVNKLFGVIHDVVIVFLLTHVTIAAVI